MIDLTVAVISYKRPQLLRDTLTSIKANVGGLKAKLVVVDNETSEDTRAVIEAANVDEAFFLSNNRGINWPLQYLVGPTLESEYVCVSDHDLHFARPFSHFLDFLRDNPDVAYCKGCDSVEHREYGTRAYLGEEWRLKRTERGGGLVMSSATFRAAMPFPVHQLLEWDWHMCYRGGPFAVLPGTVAHAGYQSSTWQGETDETHILVDGVIVPNPKNKAR